MAGNNKSIEKNRIEKSNKAKSVIRGYFESRKEHTRNNIPATIYLVEGLVEKNLIEDSRNGLLDNEDRLGDRAICFYANVVRYDDLFIVSVARDNRSDFIKNVMESNIYIDVDYLLYIHDSYFINDTREDGYEILDRYILSKIAIYMDTEKMYNFFETMYNELHESRALESLLYFIDDFANSSNGDNDFLGTWRKTDDSSRDGLDVSKGLMNLLNLYITYLYNEVIIHGNSKVLDKNNMNNFISFMGNLKPSIVTIEPSFFDTFTYDMCGIKCKVFNLHLKQILLDVIDRVERSQVLGLGGGMSSYLFQRRLQAYNMVLKDFKALTIRMPIDGDEDENLVADGCGGKHSKWYYMKKKEKELVSANLTMDSMCITKEYFESIDVMRLTQRESQAKSFFKESFNFHITRTENEKINQFARRIAQTQILYTNMNNIWNKQDATDKAFDIKSDLDEEITSTTSESYRKALLNLSDNLNKIMAEGEKVDIKTQRQSIYVNYPVGYKG